MNHIPPQIRVAALAVVFLVALGAAESVTASETPPWGGAWHLSGGSADQSAREKAIEEATADLSRFKRGVAQSRLEEKLAPPKQLVLRLTGAELEVIRDGKAMKLSTDGKARTVETPNGRATAKVTVAEKKLVVTANSDNGTRTTVYERAGNALKMTVELKVEMLSRPLRVSSTYTPAP